MHVNIGLIVGIIMGLTGAGGALISIPLFIHLLGTGLKEATVLSLVAVLLGTIINLFGQFRLIDRKIVFFFTLFGGVSNYLTLPLKKELSDIYIALLLAIIGIYSIWSVWHGQNNPASSTSKGGTLKMIFTGLLLGLITTLTGLGGGVILVPLLIGIFNKSYEDALPTSLATIFLISLISLVMQFETSAKLITVPEISLLAVGVMVSYGILKLITKKISKKHLALLRKIVFSSVAIYSIVTVFYKAI